MGQNESTNEGNPKEASVQGAPVQGAPVQGAPVQGAPVQGAPVQGAPVQGAPVQGATVQEASGNDTSNNQTSGHQTSGNETSGNQTSGNSTSSNDAIRNRAPSNALPTSIMPQHMTLAKSISLVFDRVGDMDRRTQRRFDDVLHDVRSLRDQLNNHDTHISSMRLDLSSFRQEMKDCCKEMRDTLQRDGTAAPAGFGDHHGHGHRGPCGPLYINGTICGAGNLARAGPVGGDHPGVPPQDEQQRQTTVRGGILQDVQRSADQQEERSTNQQEERPINQQEERSTNQQEERPINKQEDRSTNPQGEGQDSNGTNGRGPDFDPDYDLTPSRALNNGFNNNSQQAPRAATRDAPPKTTDQAAEHEDAATMGQQAGRDANPDLNAATLASVTGNGVVQTTEQHDHAHGNLPDARTKNQVESSNPPNTGLHNPSNNNANDVVDDDNNDGNDNDDDVNDDDDDDNPSAATQHDPMKPSRGYVYVDQEKLKAKDRGVFYPPGHKKTRDHIINPEPNENRTRRSTASYGPSRSASVAAPNGPFGMPGRTTRQSSRVADAGADAGQEKTGGKQEAKETTKQPAKKDGKRGGKKDKGKKKEENEDAMKREEGGAENDRSGGRNASTTQRPSQALALANLRGISNRSTKPDPKSPKRERDEQDAGTEESSEDDSLGPLPTQSNSPKRQRLDDGSSAPPRPQISLDLGQANVVLAAVDLIRREQLLADHRDNRVNAAIWWLGNWSYERWVEEQRRLQRELERTRGYIDDDDDDDDDDDSDEEEE